MKTAIRRFTFTALAVAMSQLPIPSHAELIDNGDGLIYDTVLDITWAQPEVFNNRTWDDASSVVAGLMLGGVSGWRLPYISVAAGGGPFSGNPVDCVVASEVECRDNELGYMYYWNFGATQGQPVPPNGDPNVLALFPDLTVVQNYWSGTEFDAAEAWYFSFANGIDSYDPKTLSNAVWAVHDGYVAGPRIFGDDFESGDTSEWFITVP
jgi:hypothetical protein